MKQMWQEIKEIFISWKSIIRFMFSFNGIVTRKQFVVALLLLCVIFQPFYLEEYSLKLSYITELIAFYCVLLLVQKRCRDFGAKGTFWILAVTIMMIASKGCHFIDNSMADFWININRAIITVQIMVFLLLILIPSQPNPNMNLRSPLLKYPLLYTAVCWGLAICATLTVNHYAGVTIF
jgi:uncharacterized membrane protein YhaH (DUF805 family)